MMRRNATAPAVPNVIRPRVKTSYIHFGMGVLLCLACDQERKESQRCVDSRAAARAAAAAGEADETKRQLNVAKSDCGEASAYDIDRIERQLQRLLRRQQQVAASNERRGPLGPFMDWVASQREEEDRKRGQTECAPRGSEAFGFCTSSVPQNNRAPFQVEYLESRPDDVFRFHWTTSAPLHCGDAGTHRVVGSWTQDDTTFTLCELTEHEFLGLEALLSRNETGTDVQVFSQSYLLERPEFSRALRRR